MDSLFPIMSYTPSLIALLDKGALMYDTKYCNLILQAERVAMSVIHQSYHKLITIWNSLSIK